MAKDLTTSALDRQNILNNSVALPRIKEGLGVAALEFDGQFVLTKQMVADFYEVDIRTITNILNANEEELKFNGYRILMGNQLKEFKLRFDKEIDFPIKTVRLGIFDFRSFLNIGMLLTTSEKAKMVRSRILDIVIATINEKTGGGTKYINRRDRDYLPAAIQEENYHKNLTDAVKNFAFDAIEDPNNHMDAVEEFESGFIQGAEWLFENINKISDKKLEEALELIDEAIENQAKLLMSKCETNDFTEEEKLVLLESFKYPYKEGIDWAYDNFAML